MDNNKTLAMVNGAAIRESDVLEAIAGMGAQAQQYSTPEGQQIILEQLIAQKLFLADAKRNMMEYEPAFKQELARVKDDLLYRYAVSKALSNVKVTEAEIKKFYDDNPDQFAAQPVASASHILVSTEKQANELLEQINAGEITFEDAARRFSSCPSSANGGSLGDFGRGQMVPEFDEACFSMQPGEIKGPVKTQFGYHIIRLDSLKTSETVSFNEARDAIESHLMNEKRQKAFTSKVNQLKIMFPVDRG